VTHILDMGRVLVEKAVGEVEVVRNELLVLRNGQVVVRNEQAVVRNVRLVAHIEVEVEIEVGDILLEEDNMVAVLMTSEVVEQLDGRMWYRYYPMKHVSPFSQPYLAYYPSAMEHDK